MTLDITIPTTSNIQLSDSAGNIDIDNVDGPIALQTDAGNITAKGATPYEGGNCQASSCGTLIIVLNLF